MRACGRVSRCALVLLALAVVTGGALADVLLLRSGQRVQANRITFRRSTEEYVAQVGTAESRYPAAQVREVRVARPPRIDSAAEKMRAGDYLSAIAILRTVEQDYFRLNWDHEAQARLAECYFQTGESRRAVALVEELLKVPNLQIPAEVNRRYLQALTDAGELLKVEEQITRMMGQGTREAAAAAALMRGDLLLSRKLPEEALIKGYLPVVELFRDVKELQPEALYKAVQALKAAGDAKAAAVYRKRLLEKHARSDYAQKMKLEG